MGSWYRYRQRDQLKGHQNSTHGISFDAFLTAYMSEDRPHFARVGGQARFFKQRPDDQPLDHFRFCSVTPVQTPLCRVDVGAKIQGVLTRVLEGLFDPIRDGSPQPLHNIL